MSNLNEIAVALRDKNMDVISDFVMISLIEVMKSKSRISKLDNTKVEDKKTLDEDAFFVVIGSSIATMMTSPCTVESLSAFQKILKMQLEAKTVNFAETKEAIKKMMIVVDEMILEYQEIRG